MASDFLQADQSLQDLINRIPGHEREIYKSFKHMRAEPMFNDRVLVVYRPTGLNEFNEHRPPIVLTTLRVNYLYADSDGNDSVYVSITDDTTGEEMEVDYVPKRLFDYDIFAHIPPEMSLHWRARVDHNGAIKRSLSWLLLLKTKNRADWYSAGVMQAESPNNFRRLFPKSPLMFS